MDVDFIVFEILFRHFRVERYKINQPSDKVSPDVSLDYQIIFQVRETLIPFIIQIIFYDKILERYSVHHYQLQKVSETVDLNNYLRPQLTSSQELIESEGIENVLDILGSRTILSGNRQYYIAMTRVVKPLGYMNEYFEDEGMEAESQKLNQGAFGGKMRGEGGKEE